MKLQHIVLSTVFALFLLTSCEKDAIETEITTADLKVQLHLNAKEQAPSALFDYADQGIYHGVIANKNSQDRGKIWVNLGNNTKYDATIEMVNGKKFYFTVSKKSYTAGNYSFEGEAGSFSIEINDVNTLEVTQMTVRNELYFAYLIKSTSLNRATSYTGTYGAANGAFAGTWNVLSNGADSPNGFSGTAISDTVVTLAGGDMFVDTDIEQGVFGCANTLFWVPIVDIRGVSGDGVLAFGQESMVNGGLATWSFGYSGAELFNNASYVTETCDRTVTSGNFTWVNQDTNNTIVGEIFIDIAP